MVLLLLPCAWANSNADCANTNASANTITIKLFLLILFMIQWSPSPPLRKSGKDALLRGRSPDSRPKCFTYSPRLPIRSGTVAFSSRISLPFTVARAVAALHRSSRSPLAHHGCQRRDWQRTQNTLCLLSPFEKLLTRRAGRNKARCKSRARSEMQMYIASQHAAGGESFLSFTCHCAHAVTPQNLFRH